MSPLLRCPACRNPLTSSSAGASCTSGHNYDRARQGYLNLLPGHKKRSANPGDNPEMVQSRNRFLNSGSYLTPVTHLLAAAKTALTGKDTPVIVDAGCGEGYYTSALTETFPKARVIGFDISRPAVQACCRRQKNTEWLVASVADIPVLDNSADLIISVFSRIDWTEFGRILKPGGQVLILGPGPDHLLELRQKIYDNVRPYPEDKLLQQLPDNFVFSARSEVTDTMSLDSSAIILDLLAMTPHFWHIKPAQKQQLEQAEKLVCRIDMRLYSFIFQPAEHTPPHVEKPSESSEAYYGE